MAHFIARSADVLRPTVPGQTCKELLPGGQAVGNVRRLNLHEYQSKNLMDKFNVRTQRGQEASTRGSLCRCGRHKKVKPDAELVEARVRQVVAKGTSKKMA